MKLPSDKRHPTLRSWQCDWLTSISVVSVRSTIDTTFCWWQDKRLDDYSVIDRWRLQRFRCGWVLHRNTLGCMVHEFQFGSVDDLKLEFSNVKLSWNQNTIWNKWWRGYFLTGTLDSSTRTIDVLSFTPCIVNIWKSTIRFVLLRAKAFIQIDKNILRNSKVRLQSSLQTVYAHKINGV